MNLQKSRFVWYEMYPIDAAPLAEFYKKVLPWTVHHQPDHNYLLLNVGEVQVGGMLTAHPGGLVGDGKAAWASYIGVASIENSLLQLQSLGGTVHRAVQAIPTVGRFAVVADPEGAIFMLFEPSPGSKESRLPPATPGGVGWHELNAVNWETCWPFYAAMFGWTKGPAIPMGELGTYQIFDIDDVSVGAMMTRIDDRPARWQIYFDVSDTPASMELVKQHGGSITHGPATVPGGQVVAHCLDPQGGAFGLVAPPQ